MKEHMRKKGHKKINPRNVSYDKYYIVNYLEFGRSWKEKDLDDAIDEEMPNGFISDDDDQGRYPKTGPRHISQFCNRFISFFIRR